MNRHKRTFSATDADASAQRGWWVVDATDVPLGRLASVVAQKIRGKDKPIFTTHIDTGDFVIVVNIDKVKITGNKFHGKKYYHHSGFPGGLREASYAEVVAKHPDMPITKAVRGMLPKNRLGRKLIKKLKVYTGPDHPHTAQNPQLLSMG